MTTGCTPAPSWSPVGGVVGSTASCSQVSAATAARRTATATTPVITNRAFVSGCPRGASRVLLSDATHISAMATRRSPTATHVTVPTARVPRTAMGPAERKRLTTARTEKAHATANCSRRPVERNRPAAR